MKNIFLRIIVVCCLYPLMLACETILEIELPDEPQRLTVNSLFIVGDSLQINLSKSLGILDNSEFPLVNDAEVNITFPDGTNHIFQNIGNGNYLLNRIPPEIGLYQLNATHPQLPNVSALASVPEPVTVKSVNLRPTRFEGNSYYEVAVNFEDNKEEENFYGLKIIATGAMELFDFNPQTGEFEIDTILSREPVFFLSNDPVFSQTGFGSLQVFDDKIFNGSEYTLKVLIPNYYVDGFDVNDDSERILEVFFLSLSKDYFLYQSSLNRYNNSSGDPFSQPSQVYTNINNGFGIFAGYSEFKFEYKP